jgi:Superinfection immunity protein
MRRWAMVSILAFGLLAHGSAQQSSTADNEALPAQEPATESQPAITDQTVTALESPDSENAPQVPTPVPSDPPQYEAPQQADSPAPSTDTPTTVAVQPASTSEAESGLSLRAFVIFCIAAVIFCLYWVPAINGFQRKHRNAVPILLVNFFFGWTFIGWVVALVWSSSDNVPAPA